MTALYCTILLSKKKLGTLKGALDRCLMVKHLLLACCMRGEREEGKEEGGEPSRLISPPSCQESTLDFYET